MPIYGRKIIFKNEKNANINQSLKIYKESLGINDKYDFLLKYNNDKTSNSITLFLEKKLKFSDSIKMIYKSNIVGNEILVLDEIFVRNNIKHCKLIYNNKKNNLKSKLVINDSIKTRGVLNIKLTGINNVRNMYKIFFNCSNLISLPDINKWDTKYIINMSRIFCACTSLSSLPDLSSWKTNNVINMAGMFWQCKSLKSIPDISKWNIENVYDLGFMFCECFSITSLPDISKWNTINVKSFSKLFYLCKKLKKLPDISKWNTTKANFIYEIFLVVHLCKIFLIFQIGILKM